MGHAELSLLTNPLASPIQLETSNSNLDAVPRALQTSIHYETARLLQAAGILLRLPQEIVAQSIVILYRFWIGPDGGSLVDHDSMVRRAAVVPASAPNKATTVTRGSAG